MKRLTRCFSAVLLGCLLLACCDGEEIEDRDFRKDMRDFVVSVSDYARGADTDFIVIPQNGHALLTGDGEPEGLPAAGYIAAIDGVGREDLFYGYDADDVATLEADRAPMLAFMDLAVTQGLSVLATDYCFTHSLMDDSYARNAERGYISFAAPSRNLDCLPDYPATPYGVSTGDVTALSDAASFLYLLSPDTARYPTKDDYLSALAATDYDLLILDFFYEDDGGELYDLDAADLDRIRAKHGGGSRLLICYMSIGEAEDYRFYWDEAWEVDPPAWLGAENPSWAGNYKVRYWDPEWQAVIFGDSGAYLDRIVDAGFDGVYLDIIDAYEYFEELVGG